MITKGIVLNRLVGENKYMVRIPILESAGDVEISRVSSILSIVPGIYESYNEGDVVIIGFEEHSSYNPVILGKLYKDGDSEARGYVHSQSLEVTDSAILPKNTKINGYDVGDLANTIEFLKSQIKELSDRVSALESK